MRTLTRWEPMSEMANATRTVDRMFDELMGRGLRRVFSEGAVRGSWTPAVDIIEKENGIHILADLPGFKPEDVDLTVEGGVLTVRGERRFEEATEGETYHRIERVYGVFERTFTLPNSVDTTKIEAKFANGEMIVTLPKREESKPRSVKVKVQS
jgi:HSP20 family protein